MDPFFFFFWFKTEHSSEYVVPYTVHEHHTNYNIKTNNKRANMLLCKREIIIDLQKGTKIFFV